MKYTFTLLLSLLMLMGIHAQKEVLIPTEGRSTVHLNTSTDRSGQGLAMDTLIPPIFAEDCANQIFALQPTDQWGFVGGTNGFMDQEKAQKFEFDESSSYTVFEVGVFFASASVVGDGPLRVKIYDVDGATGGPGNLLGTSDDIKVSDIATDDEDLLVTIFDFTTPAQVDDDEFFVSVDFSDLYASNDTVGIFQSDVDCGSGEDAWELFNGTWVSMFASWVGLEADLFIVALVDFQESTSVSDLEEDINFRIYPSPASDIINVSYDLSSTSFVNFEVFSIDGKRLLSQLVTERSPSRNLINLDVSDLDNGYYLSRITTDKGSVTKSFVISK